MDRITEVIRRISYLEHQIRNLKIAVIVVMLYFIYDSVTTLDFESLYKAEVLPKTAGSDTPLPKLMSSSIPVY